MSFPVNCLRCGFEGEIYHVGFRQHNDHYGEALPICVRCQCYLPDVDDQFLKYHDPQIKSFDEDSIHVTLIPCEFKDSHGIDYHISGGTIMLARHDVMKKPIWMNQDEPGILTTREFIKVTWDWFRKVYMAWWKGFNK